MTSNETSRRSPRSSSPAGDEWPYTGSGTAGDDGPDPIGPLGSAPGGAEPGGARPGQDGPTQPGPGHSGPGQPGPGQPGPAPGADGESPARQDASESTRLLCAAAYLNPSFARGVVKILRDGHRAVAPAYGVDLVPVVRHCLAARRRLLARNLALTCLVVLTIVLAYNGLSSVGASLVRLLLLGWAVVFVLACLDRYQVLPSLLRDSFAGHRAPVPASLVDHAALEELDRLAHGNVTVYSGFSPFVGAGIADGSWSFTTDVSKGKQDVDGRIRAPKPFEVEQLYEFVAAALHELPIPGLRVTSRLFVSGQDLRDHRWLLPDPYQRPLAHADDERLLRYARWPDEQVRHYLTVQATGWGGELVVSVFLRFAITGTDLFTEASRHVLPPLRETYREVDATTPLPDPRNVLRLIGSSAVATIPALIMAPFLVAGEALSLVGETFSDGAARREISMNPMFDFGATASVRELAMSRRFRRYFQKSDHSMYVKLIQYRVFDAMTRFLDDHDISVEDAREQRVNIINSGVMMSGGTLNAGNLAVGLGARAAQVVRTVTKPPA